MFFFNLGIWIENTCVLEIQIPSKFPYNFIYAPPLI